MPGWQCPDCARHFARPRQSHECAPALSLEEYFATASPRERPIFEAVLRHLETVGRVTVEPVSVGIFIKKTGGFIELRPMRDWVALSFGLTRRVRHPRIVRQPIEVGPRTFHVLNLRGPDDIDDQIRDWLVEAYLSA